MLFFAPAVHMYVLCGSPLSCGLAAGCGGLRLN
jgi:hypothetical protein